MRVIQVQQFGGPEVLQIAELPEPIPGPGQIVVRLHAIGVNPVDTYIRSGTYARKPALPYTPGADGAGVIAKLGAGIGQLHVGQRVYVNVSGGTYAQAVLCEENQVHPLPARISFSQGAALGVPYLTAHFALFERAAALPGDTLLIHGATGGVGIAALQLARAAGLTVFATGGSPAGRQLALQQGAHEVFDHSALGYREEILEKTGGRGVDVILEMLANVNLAHDLTLLAPGGRVAVIGSRGPVEINPRDLMGRNADVRGVVLFGVTPEGLGRIHAALRAGLENGTLDPVIGREFPLSQAAEAHAAILAGSAQGKIILLPED